MRYTTLFFDLDDTLYPNTSGLWPAIRERMSTYMVERLGLDEEVVPALRRSYFETYGTTLRGLQAHFGVDAEDYLQYVHDLPLETYIGPDPELRRLLLSLPQQKWVFTNADANHARRVLKIVGLTDCFTGIIDVHAIRFACKPEPEAYQRALELVREHNRGTADGADRPLAAGEYVFFDDSPANLAAARLAGFTTVLVGCCQPDPSADLAVASLKDLPEAMPELWADS